jgi:hypothetical protein
MRRKGKLIVLLVLIFAYEIIRFPFSPMQRFQRSLRVEFRDAEQGAGVALEAAVTLFPVLEGVVADLHSLPADEPRA